MFRINITLLPNHFNIWLYMINMPSYAKQCGSLRWHKCSIVQSGCGPRIRQLSWLPCRVGGSNPWNMGKSWKILKSKFLRARSTWIVISIYYLYSYHVGQFIPLSSRHWKQPSCAFWNLGLAMVSVFLRPQNWEGFVKRSWVLTRMINRDATNASWALLTLKST